MEVSCALLGFEDASALVDSIRDRMSQVATVNVFELSGSKFSTSSPLDLAIIAAPAAKVLQVSELCLSMNEDGIGPIITVMDGRCDEVTIRTVLSAGAFDFVSWPVGCDEIVVRVQRAIGLLKRTAIPPQVTIDPRIRGIVGAGASISKLLHMLPTIASSDAGVLLSGETGTGKEVFARAIHYLSNRASKAWVAVNCAAIPLELVESELFGHVRGAFTHAMQARAGLIQEAEGGTLFLDDVDALPLQAQAKLLRFLQEREYRAVGSNTVRTADVRVISASNRDLLEMVRIGVFRQDLYFRLNVLTLRLPPLRDRREDIRTLSNHFATQFSLRYGRPMVDISMPTLRKLLAHTWPGNVRELQHVIERAVLLCNATSLTPEDIDLPAQSVTIQTRESLKVAKARHVSEFERDYIEELLRENHGNISQAARSAGKNRRAFFSLLRKHGIDAQLFRG